MKIPKEFTYRQLGDASPSIVITGLSLQDIYSRLTFLIHYIYGKLKSIDPALARGFRSILVSCLTDERSPVWTDVKDTPGAAEICFAIPKEKTEGQK